MNRIVLKIVDAVFVTRPILLVPVWGYGLLGCARHSAVAGEGLKVFAWPALGTIGWLALFSLSVGAVYVLNQEADFDVDRDNDGFPLLASGAVTRRSARITTALLAAGSLVPALALRPWLAVFSVAAIALGLIYSFKPIRLCGRPGFDFIANALGYGIVAFGAGWYLAGGTIRSGGFGLQALPYVLLMCAGSISSTLPDIAGDRAHGKRTTAVALGSGPAHLLACGFLLAAIAAATWRRDTVALICGAAAAPFYGAYLVHKSQRFMEATYKAGGTACMAVVGILFPLFALFSAVVAAATVVYFRKRFGVTYPSLTPVSRSR